MGELPNAARPEAGRCGAAPECRRGSLRQCGTSGSYPPSSVPRCPSSPTSGQPLPQVFRVMGRRDKAVSRAAHRRDGGSGVAGGPQGAVRCHLLVTLVEVALVSSQPRSHGPSSPSWVVPLPGGTLWQFPSLLPETSYTHSSICNTHARVCVCARVCVRHLTQLGAHHNAVQDLAFPPFVCHVYVFPHQQAHTCVTYSPSTWIHHIAVIRNLSMTVYTASNL